MSLLGRIPRIARRHWSERARYTTAGDWLMSMYNRTMIHAPRLPLPGRRRIREVRVTGATQPLVVRLGTSDWYAMEEVFVHDEYGPILRRLQRAQTIVDLGANVGMSIRLWQSHFPGARIVAVEPDAKNIEIARRNVRNETNVVLIQACVAARPRRVRLDRSRSEYAFRMVERAETEARGESLEAITVTEVLRRGQIAGEIDLLKCDIEGAEAEVFADCRDWISRVQNLVVEVHAPYSSARLREDLRSAGSTLQPFHVDSKGDIEVVFLARAN